MRKVELQKKTGRVIGREREGERERGKERESGGERETGRQTETMNQFKAFAGILARSWTETD